MRRPGFRSFFSHGGTREPLVLLLLVLCAVSCRSTHFPEDPAAHPLWEELQEAPDEYYFLVRTGVRSRVLGILPEEKMRRQLERVRHRWEAIERWKTTDALITYLRTHGLTPIAERVTATLTANTTNTPPDGIDERLEVGAVKIGLLGAYHSVREGERGNG